MKRSERFSCWTLRPKSGMAVSDFFTARGHRVVRAPAGPGALAALHRVRPAVLLLNLGPLGTDGADVLQRIRDWDPGLRVIVTAGAGDEALARRLIALGAFDVVAEPVDFNYLDRAVFSALVEAWGLRCEAPADETELGGPYLAQDRF